MVFKVDVYLFRLFLLSFLKVRQGQWEQRKQGGRAQQVGPLIYSESCRNHLLPNQKKTHLKPTSESPLDPLDRDCAASALLYPTADAYLIRWQTRSWNIQVFIECLVVLVGLGLSERSLRAAPRCFNRV